jgi:hypothetical protein
MPDLFFFPIKKITNSPPLFFSIVNLHLVHWILPLLPIFMNGWLVWVFLW